MFQWCKYLLHEAELLNHRFAVLLHSCRYPELLTTGRALQHASRAEEQIREVSRNLLLQESAAEPSMKKVGKKQPRLVHGSAVSTQ